jgi:3-oxoacyl-[acyl-carrier-protein] synthase III
MEITKEEFKAYVRVQKSGVTNMFAVDLVQQLSNLSREKVFKIMQDYGILSEKYPDVTGGA